MTHMSMAEGASRMMDGTIQEGICTEETKFQSTWMNGYIGGVRC